VLALNAAGESLEPDNFATFAERSLQFPLYFAAGAFRLALVLLSFTLGLTLRFAYGLLVLATRLFKLAADLFAVALCLFLIALGFLVALGVLSFTLLFPDRLFQLAADLLPVTLRLLLIVPGFLVALGVLSFTLLFPDRLFQLAADLLPVTLRLLLIVPGLLPFTLGFPERPFQLAADLLLIALHLLLITLSLLFASNRLLLVVPGLFAVALCLFLIEPILIPSAGRIAQSLSPQQRRTQQHYQPRQSHSLLLHPFIRSAPPSVSRYLQSLY
jgi:hypothetical protein